MNRKPIGKLQSKIVDFGLGENLNFKIATRSCYYKKLMCGVVLCMEKPSVHSFFMKM